MDPQNPRQNPGSGLDPNEIATIIQNLVKGATDKLSQRTYKRGIISAVTGQKASVKVEGNTVATPGVICLDNYRPQVNDKVLLLSIGDSGANLVILGRLSATPTATQWITPTLINGWVNYDAPSHATVQYMRDSEGFVHLKGLAKNGAMPSEIFVLPVGFRPALVEHFPSYSNGAFGGVRVDNTNGNVRLEQGGNPWFSLAGITFLAVQ